MTNTKNVHKNVSEREKQGRKRARTRWNAGEEDNFLLPPGTFFCLPFPFWFTFSVYLLSTFFDGLYGPCPYNYVYKTRLFSNPWVKVHNYLLGSM